MTLLSDMHHTGKQTPASHTPPVPLRSLAWGLPTVCDLFNPGVSHGHVAQLTLLSQSVQAPTCILLGAGRQAGRQRLPGWPYTPPTDHPRVSFASGQGAVVMHALSVIVSCLLEQFIIPRCPSADRPVHSTHSSLLCLLWWTHSM